MSFLTAFLDEYSPFSEIHSGIAKGLTPMTVTGVNESQKAHLCFALFEAEKRSMVILTSNELQARHLYEDLLFFARYAGKSEQVLLFLDREPVFYDVDAVGSDVKRQRMQTLFAMSTAKDPILLVCPIDAAMRPILPKERFLTCLFTFHDGDHVDLETLRRQFVLAGYHREDVVEGRGQFSIRGGIVDFFGYDTENGIRIELFDDEVDSIRAFDVESQLSYKRLKQAELTPVSEIIYTREEAEKLLERLEQNPAGYAQDLEKIAERHYFPSLDKYHPLIYPKRSSVLDYLDAPITVLDEPQKLNAAAESFCWNTEETLKSMLEKGVLCEIFEGYWIPYADLLKRATDSPLIGMAALQYQTTDYRARAFVDFSTKTVPSYQGNFDYLLEALRAYTESKTAVLLLSGTKGRTEKLAQMLTQEGFSAYEIAEPYRMPSRGEIGILRGSLHKGFEYPHLGIAVVSDTEAFGRQKKRKPKKKNALRSYRDLSIGDFVVHQNHGIGQYAGIEQVVIDGVTKDYLKIRYQGTDLLYVPVNQLDFLYKYVGGENQRMKLNKLGGTDWAKTKAKVRASCEELARSLVALYASRQQQSGYAFSPDTPWQRQFEETFPYEETEDQLTCIDEVKRDMESARPMDRLLCGDVGYGKTEVALRAAFKAVNDGKQVAYLVPTTLLAQQQYTNFKERMKDFPVQVEMLCRFRTPAQQKKIVADVKAGRVDVIIGTHRLLQKDLSFKDLGLLIIDEEQRFGVTHKEKIKEMRQNVDVLTLTATPIPRTLHMAMVGIRDMSVIEQPPQDRYPVQTYVLEYNEGILTDAIAKEIARGGQVYYLCNRIGSVGTVAARLAKALPDIRIATAHGRMEEAELENIMSEMLAGDIDVLVCTTIIETGLDIPNVNTIIIEDSDRLGLSQLYQLRGRVGRSNRLAFAYLTFRRDRVLQENAEKRLQAIREFTEFGSGFKIALRDLEIRGAGNLLGAEQHGHMDAVGYDLYCQLLEEAVKNEQGETPVSVPETTVDLQVDAFIPEAYIRNHEGRVEMYQKIAGVQNEEDAQIVEEELIDRYGDIPPSVQNLVCIATIRHTAAALGISEISQKGDSLTIRFAEESSLRREQITALISKTDRRQKVMVCPGKSPFFKIHLLSQDQEQILRNVTFMLQALN